MNTQQTQYQIPSDARRIRRHILEITTWVDDEGPDATATLYLSDTSQQPMSETESTMAFVGLLAGPKLLLRMAQDAESANAVLDWATRRLNKFVDKRCSVVAIDGVTTASKEI